jgi:hypothetical protein
MAKGKISNGVVFAGLKGPRFHGTTEKPVR